MSVYLRVGLSNGPRARYAGRGPRSLGRSADLGPDGVWPTSCPLYAAWTEGSKEIDASQAERLGRSCLYCSVLSLARSAQAERDNESCFFLTDHDYRSFDFRTICYQSLAHVHSEIRRRIILINQSTARVRTADEDAPGRLCAADGAGPAPETRWPAFGARGIASFRARAVARAEFDGCYINRATLVRPTNGNARRSTGMLIECRPDSLSTSPLFSPRDHD
ncbi:hypothetical protein EVAR_41974_1 [Eumeta japonica]|uniref:Uncharacterized protein n=1 Tax=Eumeta variegata TaxID=151549 RepID=A0A4C1WPZ4_EUMVA|nr:hypothetical protein EVAR_41974_1 [Eumeta japonica]